MQMKLDQADSTFRILVLLNSFEEDTKKTVVQSIINKLARKFCWNRIKIKTVHNEWGLKNEGLFIKV